MKNFFKYVAVALMVVVPTAVMAVEFRVGDNPSIGRSEQIADDVYMAGGSVTSAGAIAGDLITAGGNVVVSGDVSADVFVGGGNVTILSNVGDDIRVAGGQVVISGTVGGDILAAGGQVTVNGPKVFGDVLVAGGMVYLDAPIVGNVKVQANKLTLGKNANISGSLTYAASQEMVKEPGAVVQGAVDFKLHAKKATSPKAVVALVSALLVWKFLALLVCALIVGLFFRRYGKELVALAQHRPLFEMGRGLLVLVAMPAVSVLLLTTLVGIPFGILGLLGFIMLMLFSWIVTPIIMGSVIYQYLSKKEIEVSWKTILVGVLSYCILGWIPVVGGLAQFLLMLLTIGVMVALKLHILKEWR